jgi:RNA polymerase sigma factor (sigma-70 family)
MDDAALLHQYVSTGSQPAFAELVSRHIDTVYAACLRQVRDRHLAEDVTQAVFVILAKKAGSLRVQVELAGWLVKAARYASLSALRDAARRQRHEQRAAIMAPTITMPADPAPAWECIAPELDAALARLSDADRSAIVLRFMNDRPHRDIAVALSISEDAARQRVTRAVVRLRRLLLRRGVNLAGDALAAALPLSASRAPLELAHTVATAAGTKSVISTSAIVNGALRLMRVARAKIAAVAAVAFLAPALLVTFAMHRYGRTDAQALVAPSSPTRLVANVAGAAPAPAAPALASQLVDTMGRPVANAYFLADGGAAPMNGVRSDAQGKFTLTGVRPGQTNFIGFSQRSRRIALFSITPEGDLPATVALDWTEASADGCVVDAAGNPIAGVTPRLFVTTPDGSQFRFQGSRTDRTGRYEATAPSGPGLTLLASPSASATDADATAPIALDRRYQVEMPDIVMKARRGTPNPAAKRVTYSGRVFDEQGKGIPGVEIEMDYDKNHMSYTAGDVLTDAEGRFARRMPADNFINLRLRLTHPDFIGFQFGNNLNTPPTDALLSGNAVLVMKRGLTLNGMVRDQSGQPVENALVLTASSYSTTGGDSEPIEDFTSPRTDKEGKFAATGLPPGSREISISAEGFAPQVMSVDVSEGAKPVKIALDTGTTYSARIVDEDGNPLVGAHVSCDGWEAKERRPDQPQDRQPLVRLATADADGRLVLNNLPREGKLHFYAGPAQRGEIAGVGFDWSEHGKNLDAITLYRYPVLEGKVVDAETGSPVHKFKVTPGWDTGRGFDPMTFSYSKTVNPGDGSFSKRIDGFISSVEDTTKFQLQISAEGYAPELTPPVRLGEKHGQFVLQLRRVQPVTGTVIDAEGNPLEGAEVILAGPRHNVTVLNGRLNDQYSNVPDIRVTTKRDGRFSLSGGDGLLRLVVLHEQGYALLDPKTLKPGDTVSLTKWARIEGAASFDDKPANGLSISALQSNTPSLVDGFNIHFELAATADVNGHFVLDHVPAVPLTVSGAQDSKQVDPKAGATLTVELRGHK